MIKIFKSQNSKQFYIEGVTFGPSEDFNYIREGDNFTIDRSTTKVVEVSNARYTLFADINGDVFPDADSFEAYLVSQLQVDIMLTQENSLAGGNTLINISGRFYCYTNNRWVTDSDDNYGSQYYQFNENCGTGLTPLIEWEHKGIIIPAGRKIKALHFAGDSNNSQITDLELYAVIRKPNPITKWETGMDGDGEQTRTFCYIDDNTRIINSESGLNISKYA